MKIKVEEKDLLDLIFWARRYCDSRSTYAPSDFNRIYMNLRSYCPETVRKDQFDQTLKDKGTFWPFAQDSMYNPTTKAYNAIPSNSLLNTTTQSTDTSSQ